jgi:molybdopterin molybdotransferase
MLISFEEALATLREELSAARHAPTFELVPLAAASGRFLAEDVRADRDYPPFHRSIRDGYAVRSSETRAAVVHLVRRGEVRAGEYLPGEVGPGECVEIMTGAPVPAGADAVVMIEHVRVDGSRVEVARPVGPWENVVLQGSEARAGSVVLRQGRRVGAGELGLLASVGHTLVRVARQPEVAILPTGDEVVSLDQKPEWFQIRNSNAQTLAALVATAGGRPRLMPITPDEKESLRRRVQEGLESDLLLLSGGVSMGKYDFVDKVLAELGARFAFQRVAIRPGKPVLFGRVGEKFFFGLPGNPVSTYVTFELFVRPAIAMLSGGEFGSPVFLRARLGRAFQQKHGLTAFMPARVEMRDGDPVVELVGWQGSGDLVGAAAANCFLVVHPGQMELAAGHWVDVLPKSA